MGYSVFHMFAGAGGGILADLLLGHRTVGAIEIEAYPRQVLIDRQLDGSLPQFPIWDDVRTFSYENTDTRSYIDWLRERRDSLVIAAGFPCQDLSVAGKQSGLGEGTRSGLYREVIRIAGVIRPRFLFLENVAAILSGGLEHVLADLASRGYDCRWTCLRASECGAKHHRDRWWLRAVRNADNDGQPSAEISRSITSGSDDYKTREKQASELEGSSEQYANVADTMRECIQGELPSRADAQEWARSEQRQDRPCRDGIGWWAAESDVGLLAHGVADGLVRRSGEEEVDDQSIIDSRQDLPSMQQGFQSTQDAKRKIAGREAVREANVLQSDMREHQRCSDKTRLFVESEEASGESVRGVRVHEEATGSPHRSGQNEQHAGKHPDALQALPRLLAHDREADGVGDSRKNAKREWWQEEPPVGRVAQGIKDRTHRIKALGNGQVPLQAAVAWKLLGGE